jgi:hypothetical protein
MERAHDGAYVPESTLGMPESKLLEYDNSSQWEHPRPCGIGASLTGRTSNGQPDVEDIEAGSRREELPFRTGVTYERIGASYPLRTGVTFGLPLLRQ